MRRKGIAVLAGALLITGAAASTKAAESEFHGQFRINYYSESQSEGVDTAAARLRWRPTWDAKVSDDVSMHMQLNIGHIESNTSNARYDKSVETAATPDKADPAVAIRHAYLNFKLPEVGGNVVAGLVPISDKFGDTLFSSDWDFNPLAVAWLGKIGVADVRIGTGKLSEGTPADTDDVDAYVLDVDVLAGSGTIGASVYQVTALSYPNTNGVAQTYAGVRGSQDFGVAKVNAFVLYNTGKTKGTGGTADLDNSGYAIKLEGIMPAGPAKVGVMFLTASGDKDGKDSFITPMSLIGHTGYWGYTGKLNVQGPTDTGIDAPVNIDGASYSSGSGMGLGIMTLQAKADFPITEKLSGYAAVGIFQHQDAPATNKKDIGTDIYAQGKYNLGKNLNLEAGLDYAMLPKENAATGNTKDNNVTLAFARLQLEY